jgi:hypothetical protein
MTALNGHRRDIGPRTGDAVHDATAERSVARLIRRQVAAKLTAAARAHDGGSGHAMSEPERAALTRRLITEALDAYTAGQMAAGRAPLRPDAESRIARNAADALLGVGGLQPLLDNDEIEDITANGADEVFVRYADGAVERVGPIADSDAEMEDVIRLLAARTGNGDAAGTGPRRS